jgi:hypothetical protein
MIHYIGTVLIVKIQSKIHWLSWVGDKSSQYSALTLTVMSLRVLRDNYIHVAGYLGRITELLHLHTIYSVLLRNNQYSGSKTVL